MIDTILNAANEAYENGECRINEELSNDARGDGLATFIRNEIIDVCTGEDESKQVDAAVDALLRARRQLDDVISTLEQFQ